MNFLASLIYMYHMFFIHSSMNGYLACFYVSAIVISAAMNLGVHASFFNYSFAWICAQV